MNEALKMACVKTGKHLIDISQIAGISYQTMHNAIKGKPVSVKNAKAIAMALKAIIPEEGNPIEITIPTSNPGRPRKVKVV